MDQGRNAITVKQLLAFRFPPTYLDDALSLACEVRRLSVGTGEVLVYRLADRVEELARAVLREVHGR